MKHIAHRIAEDCYLYRGYEIHHVFGDDGNYKHWYVIEPNGEINIEDDTLKECKKHIDALIERSNHNDKIRVNHQ